MAGRDGASALSGAIQKTCRHKRHTCATADKVQDHPMIHVCSLARLHETVEETGARYLVSLIGDETRLARLPGVPLKNHLWLRMHDISAPLDGYIMPAEQHVARLL